MESANILQAVEQYREQLKTITVEPSTRYFPTHEDEAVKRIREYQRLGTQLWATRIDGHG
jgi:hypothetical protein